MKRLALLLLLATTPMVGAQTVDERLAKLEANTAALNSIASRLESLEAKLERVLAAVEAKAGKPPIQHLGYTFVWDGKKYRPEGQGWYWDAASYMWCRDAAGKTFQYHTPAIMAGPGIGAFDGIMCQDGNCQPATIMRRRK